MMTTTPTRVQRRRTKGFRLPPDTVCVTRPSIWGNPYRADVWGLDLSLKLYRRSIFFGGNRRLVFAGLSLTRAQTRDALALHWAFWKRFMDAGRGAPGVRTRELLGKRLACFCPLDRPCHVDVLIDVTRANWNASGRER